MEDAGHAGDDDGARTLSGGRRYGSGITMRATTALLWVLGVALLLVIIYAGWQLWSALQTAYEPLWQRFWIATYILFGLVMAYISASMLGPVLGRLLPFLRQTRLRAERVQMAAIAGDDMLVPLVTEQPEPLAASELPVGTVTFGPFAPTRRHRSQLSLGYLLVTLLIIIGVTVGLVLLYVNFLPTFGDGPFLAWMRPMFVIMLILMALTALTFLAQIVYRLGRRLRGGPRVERVRLAADDWSLRLLDGGRRKERQPIVWHEARAFYKADDLLRLQGQVIRKSTPQKTTYTLAAAMSTLSWTIWEDSSAEQRASSDHLCRLVVTHTRRPLRDVTAFTTQLSADLLELVSPLLLPFPDKRITIEDEQDAGTADEVPTHVALSATSPTSRRIGATWSRWLMASRIAAIGIAILAIAAGMLTQGIQGIQYSNLLDQQIGYELPYYEIDFRTNDGAWPNHAATASDGSYTFKTDGYYMTGAPGGRAMEAVLPAQYGDATVQLTAGLTDVVPASDIGVVLRESNDGTDKVVFTLTSSGGWSLVRIHAASGTAPQRIVLMSDDHSDAVRTGKGSYNYLAVIMRGSGYLCFVRDRLVGIYHDSSGQTPRQGHMGLWLGNSHAVGRFYSFAVYPAY